MAIQDLIFPPGDDKDATPNKINHGGHNISVADVVDFEPTAVTPFNIADHTFQNVVLDRGIVRAEKCSITEADEAEETADRLEIDVQNGIRRLKAASKVRMAEAKLQTGFRAYQAVNANAALLKAKANGKLAKHLLNQRQSWAELGYGVERTIAQTDSQVSTTRYKYLGA